jgi:16S rRNA (guanine(1405)-N(7))-methyltransferase
MAEPFPGLPESLFQELLREVRSSRKYRTLDLPEETLRDLLSRALERQPNPKAALQSVREKLHNIVAPYLGDPDYVRAASDLLAAFAEGSPEAVRAACLGLLQSHASTRERIPLLNDFYQRLWRVSGLPAVLLDLACGLNPFSLPWMGLPAGCKYFAYDIHAPRIALINQFFQLAGQSGEAFVQDILVRPPQVEADAALFLKEAHRFDQRQRDCNLSFWQALRVRWLFVSLPTTSLSGRRDLVERQRNLIQKTLKGIGWPVSEIRFENELVFCIQKDG